MNYYILAFKKYLDFSGRSTRTEYWYFYLFNFIFGFLFSYLDNFLGLNIINSNLGLLYILYILISIIPIIAVSIRRLHDVNKSGWMLLLSLIPIIGAIWLLVLFVTDSEKGDNQYGPNPKGIIGNDGIPKAEITQENIDTPASLS